MLASIQHQFIVKMSACFQNERKLFFVLEYCNGGELFSLLQKKKRFNEGQYVNKAGRCSTRRRSSWRSSTCTATTSSTAT